MRWELRRARLWGSEHVGWFASKELALADAERDIRKNGSVGRTGFVDSEARIVYYTIYEEV